MPGPLLVVDGPSLLYRAFFALPTSIEGADGRPANALLGGLNMLLREVAAHEPRAVVVCFGPDAADYRVELYAGYHAARPPVPDELGPQFAAAPGLLRAFGWHVAHHEELEADDLLFSFATAERERGGTALLLTGDRDLYQCAGEGVEVLYMKTGAKGAERVDAREVRRRYGIEPRLVPDFIALRGDPSDGLPGARGIGEKTAAELLRRHGSLEGAIANAMRERPKVALTLREQAEELRAFREIAALRRVDVEPPPDSPTDLAAGAAAARAAGLRRLAERLESG